MEIQNKMDKKLREENVYFYYLRDGNHQPFGGVCLKKAVDGVWCRGISLCSVKDQFDRNAAKGQAYGRLIKATVTRKDDCFVFQVGKHRSCYKLLESQVFDKGFKSKYNATLTEKEKEIVKEAL